VISSTGTMSGHQKQFIEALPAFYNPIEAQTVLDRGRSRAACAVAYMRRMISPPFGIPRSTGIHCCTFGSKTS
jgi:hypothetical protein